METDALMPRTQQGNLLLTTPHKLRVRGPAGRSRQASGDLQSLPGEARATTDQLGILGPVATAYISVFFFCSMEITTVLPSFSVLERTK